MKHASFSERGMAFAPTASCKGGVASLHVSLSDRNRASHNLKLMHAVFFSSYS